MRLSCNFDQWITNLAVFASQSLTSPSLLPVKNKLEFGMVDILVTLPSIRSTKTFYLAYFYPIRRFNHNSIEENVSLPKWAFGIYQSIPSAVKDALLSGSPLPKCLCLFALPVAMYRKSWSPTSPSLPPVTMNGETEPLPMSLSNTESEWAPPTQASLHAKVSPIPKTYHGWKKENNIRILSTWWLRVVGKCA